MRNINVKVRVTSDEYIFCYCWLLKTALRELMDIIPMYQKIELGLEPLIPHVLVQQLPLHNTVYLFHFLTGHMVEYDFLLLVLPLIAWLDLFRIF